MAKFDFPSLKEVALLTADMHTDTKNKIRQMNVNSYQKCQQD
jgi:hypothetical protein